MNKSNIIRKMIVVLIISILCGVGAIPTVGTTVNQNQNNQSHVIDINDATEVALKTLRRYQKTDFSIEGSTELCALNGVQLCYIFSLHPQGYVVVSASSDLPPVIAYSFTSIYKQGEPNVLSDLLITDLAARLENVPTLPYKIMQQRQIQWESYLDDQPMNSRLFEQWPPEGSTPTGGWVLTNWDQGAPYNNFCPLDLAHGGDRSVAGCPAVAMAQILNYHNTTQAISFTDNDDYFHNFDGNQFWIDDDYQSYGFPSFPQLNSYLTTLQTHYLNHVPPTDDDKAAITFACGVAAKQVYSKSVSGTFGVSQAYDAYQRFNCTSSLLLHDTDPFFYARLSHNMMDALPVHLAVVDEGWTKGHNLVVDGYNTDNYYHLNFGWGGAYDGWYLIPDEIPYDLTVIEGAVIDILKEDTGIEDLFADGTLAWTNVAPDKTVTGSFNVSNIGEPGSYLDWEITEWPSWGTWTLTPEDGNNLTPENSTVTIVAQVVAPNVENHHFTGSLKVCNIEDINDYTIIPVSLETGLKAGEDLSSEGSLTWTKIKPGATVTGSFMVENIGKAASFLNWEITEWPQWGTWTFTPSFGVNLTPESGPIIVNVTVIAPKEKNTEFTGQVKIINTKNNSDYESIPVSLFTPFIPHFTFFEILKLLMERFSLGVMYLRHFLWS
jgi:hypothetical protein